MRHGGRALIVIGWLLTPVPVWGASALGFWIGALIGRGIPNLAWAFALALILSMTGGVGAGVVWLSGLRRLHHRWSVAHGVAPEQAPRLETAAD